MRFKSRDGKEKRIAMLDGQMAIVGKDWKELPDSMADEAYAAGCVSDLSTFTAADAEGEGALSTKNKVKRAIREMADSNDPAMFTKTGLPDRRLLNTRVGFTVTNEVFDVAWAETQAEAKEP